MNQGQTVELQIPSSPEYVAVVRRAVEGVARRMPFESGQVEDLKLAVGEACTNAIKHGSPEGRPDVVTVRCIIMPDGLLVEVQNCISECVSPEVPTHPDLSKEGGLGLYLIRNLVDEVDLLWQKETAVVKMLKRLNGCQA